MNEGVVRFFYSLFPTPYSLSFQEGRIQVEFFRGVNIDWLGKKWYFLAFSLIFSVAGHRLHGLALGARPAARFRLGVDFRGGTEVQVQFQNRPDIGAIRQAVDAAGIRDAQDPGLRRRREPQRGPDQPAGAEERERLSTPAGSRSWRRCRRTITIPFRLRKGVKVDVVGPTVGHQLRVEGLLGDHLLALGMLVYLWFRFQLIYGVAAVVACFHDTLITVGFFALTKPGNQPDGHRGHPDAGRLLDERHHRRL